MRNKKPGRYVQIAKKEGEEKVRKGLVFNDAVLIHGKVPVWIVTEEWELTDERLLVKEENLIVVGYKD